jgi:cell division protein FtsI/penicillin-binding protein 2
MDIIKSNQHKVSSRISFIKLFMIGFGFLLIARLFYIQIVKYDFYHQQASREHSRLFNPSSPRGIIYLSDGSNVSPVVLNIIKYTVIADPSAVKNIEDTASKLSSNLGIDKNKIKELISAKNRYAVIAKKIDKDLADKIKNLKLAGITLQENNVRTYPQGVLAAQVLGFVNDDGQGQYGIEQALDQDLAGKPGKVYQVTDVNGVPLVLGDSVVEQKAVAPKDVTLTIDITMQNIVEQALSSGVKNDGATQGSALVMDANSGAIKAMADFPNYDPTNFSKVSDPSIFSNIAVSNAWEPGSVMKPLLLGAAFSLNKATPDTSYLDTNSVVVDGATIKNSINWGAQTMSLRDVINKSLNVGAVFTLKTLGATTDQVKNSQYAEINDNSITETARKNYYDYLINHYKFADYTGIEQAGESKGFVNDPFSGDAINLRYANMAFGQGLSVTPIQLASAYAALTNGGTYYKPTLIQSESVNNNQFYNFKPQIVKNNVVTSSASQQIRTMLQNSLALNNTAAVRQGYIIGAKSGTAQQADGKGGYKTDAYNGAYVGFIGGDSVKYIILVRLDGPKTSGFASAAAAKVWTTISNQLLNDFPIAPKTQ